MKPSIVASMLIFFITTSSCYASNSVYLECNFPKSESLGITLNEDNGIAAVDYSSGLIQIYSAKFGANLVSFLDGKFGESSTSVFMINRTTLAILRGMISANSKIMGECKIIPPAPDRKF